MINDQCCDRDRDRDECLMLMIGSLPSVSEPPVSRATEPSAIQRYGCLSRQPD